MTYQVALCGVDGILLASDRCEFLFPAGPDRGEGSVSNMINKIRVDPSGNYAWAFAGAKPSLLASSELERRLEKGMSKGDIERTLRDCGDYGWEAAATGPSDSTILLLDGQTKTIWRAILASRSSAVSKVRGGICFAGQTYSKASFLPCRYYSPHAQINTLSRLAAYTVTVAGTLDPLIVGGCDIAVYRDAAGKFEFMPDAEIAASASALDQGIKRALE